MAKPHLATTIDFTESPSPEELAALGAGLTAHATESIGQPGFKRAVFLVRSSESTVLGGLSGMFNWNWAFIHNFWLRPELRGHGLGTELLHKFESLARERGCQQIHLDTFSFQAPTFYDRHGYTCFATLEEYPPGHRRHFYRKAL